MAAQEIARPVPDAPNPTCRVTLSKDKVKDMTVSQPITLTVSGSIKSLQPLYSDSDLYEVEIENPLVEKSPCQDSSESKPDENAATMPKEKLKEMISKTPNEGK